MVFQAMVSRRGLREFRELSVGPVKGSGVYDRSAQGVPLPAEPPGREHIYQSYVVVVDEGIDRDGLMAHLREGGAECTIGTYALHLLDFYRRTCGCEPGDFPVARSLYERTLSLPIYRGMPDDAVARVAELMHHEVG